MRGLRIILKSAGAGLIMLSALLAVASLSLWIRSYFVIDFISYEPDRSTYAILWSYGIVNFGWEIPPPLGHQFSGPGPRQPQPNHRFIDDIRYQRVPAKSEANLFGRYEPRFQFGQFMFSRPARPESYTSIRIPFWFLILVFMTLPTFWLIRRRRRIPAGRCQACGYDLCATPDRCPECGTIPRPI
jgi:hypothetical protein